MLGALRISLLSAFAGWCVGMIYCCSVTLWFTGLDRGSIVICFWIGIFMAAIILGVWLIALFPLASVVPSRSFLWSKRVLTPLGAIAGLIIAAVILYLNAINNESDWPPDMYDWHINFKNNLGTFGPPSVIIGMVTGLTGGILRSRQIASASSSDAEMDHHEP